MNIAYVSPKFRPWCSDHHLTSTKGHPVLCRPLGCLAWRGGRGRAGANGMPKAVTCDWGGGSEADVLESTSHTVRVLWTQPSPKLCGFLLTLSSYCLLGES